MIQFEGGAKTPFWIKPASISADDCGGGYKFSDDNKDFFKQAGVLTFLKSSSQLQVWFNDVMEVTWDYEDEENAADRCSMRGEMSGIKFKTNYKKDTVSAEYRYEIGKTSCMIFYSFFIVKHNPAWNYWTGII